MVNISRPSSWIGHALLASVSFAAMAACVRVASQSLPQAEVVFFRNFMALLLLLPLLLHQRVSLRTERIGLHLLRAFAGLASMYLYFHALTRLPLSDALLLNYTSPLFIALIAVVWLGEHWSRTRAASLALGLVGVGLLFQPSSAIASSAGLIGLASGALAGLALTTVKKLSYSEPSLRIVVYFALLASVISAVPMLWGFVWPRPEQWAWLIAMGLAGSLGQLGLTRAYSLAPASQVSPMGYTSLIFAGLIGFAVWGERPDLAGLIGTLTITVAGVLVARERSEPAPEPPSAVPIYSGRPGK
ncbi:MAG: DMT family transporter [Mariprofundaceae bacterium]